LAEPEGQFFGARRIESAGTASASRRWSAGGATAYDSAVVASAAASASKKLRTTSTGPAR